MQVFSKKYTHKQSQLRKNTMRKIITILILISTIPVFGQNHLLGLKSGINWTNVNSSNLISNNDYRIR